MRMLSPVPSPTDRHVRSSGFPDDACDGLSIHLFASDAADALEQTHEL
jgi:hypothetical protein